MVLARYKCDPDALIRAIRRFKGKRILVLGDMMLDRFVWGTVSRISPEAPVPVVEISRESNCMGGAANVAANIKALGGAPLAVGVIGADSAGQELRREFQDLGAVARGLIVDAVRPTSVKTRIIAHHQQVCRTDREDRSPLTSETQQRVVEFVRRSLDHVDAMVVSDYAKGLLSRPLLQNVLRAARRAKRIVCVDPKLPDLSSYRPATVITPNTHEAERAAGMKIANTKDLIRAGNRIMRDTGIRHLVVTRGEEGMALFEEAGRVTHIPTVAREVFDVTGAGDTVISTLTLGLVAGLNILESAILSNIAAGIVVGKLGTAAVGPEELSERISSYR